MDIVKNKKEDWQNLFVMYIIVNRLEYNYINNSFKVIRNKLVLQNKKELRL